MGKMNELNKRLLLTFIVRSQETGRNVHSSIVRFRDKVAKDKVSKDVSGEIIKRLEKGESLEKVLYETEVINKFQYSILELVTDKKEAFKKLSSFNKVAKGADKFYFKIWIKLFAISVGVFIGLYTINKTVFLPLITNMQKTAKSGQSSFKIDDAFQYILDNNIALLYIGVFFAVFFISCLWFYIESSRNNISMHYKYFRYKAIIQNLFLLTIIEDLLKVGMNTTSVFKALATSIEPKNLRNNLNNIKEAIEKQNNEKFEFELRRLYIDEISIFDIVSGNEDGNLKNGFVNAVKSAEEYKVEIGDFYKEIFDVLAFTLMALLAGFAGGYIVGLEINITTGM